jgi:hypothetical protein
LFGVFCFAWGGVGKTFRWPNEDNTMCPAEQVCTASPAVNSADGAQVTATYDVQQCWQTASGSKSTFSWFTLEFATVWGRILSTRMAQQRDEPSRSWRLE